MLVVSGCASVRSLRGTRPVSKSATEALTAYVDRWQSWKSLSASIKLHMRIPGQALAARGHLFYLIGERYEVGFSKPYNQILGNLYVTPGQVVYWDAQGTAHVFTGQDTVTAAHLIPLPLPNWDPRDLLPFPLSGRSEGLQADSTWEESGRMILAGNSGRVAYRFEFDRTGSLEQEWVSRAGHDPLVKRYARERVILGWPIAARVTCSDPDGTVRIGWSLSDIELEAAEFDRRESDPGTENQGNVHGG